MTKNRLEALSDGVIAIIITIMVLEFKVPHHPTFAALREMEPTFLSYLLSFMYVGIYWNNHHHLLQVTTRIDGWVMWANLHLLFWLSLIPFATAWVGEDFGEAVPTAFYGGILVMDAVAAQLLVFAIQRKEGPDWQWAKLTKNDVKIPISVVSYAAGIGLAFVYVWAAYAVFAALALVWIMPDRRIEEWFESKGRAAEREPG